MILDMITIAGVLDLIGFNAASLEQHLRQFDLTPSQVGSVFIITGSIYALTSSFWGKIAEYMVYKIAPNFFQALRSKSPLRFRAQKFVGWLFLAQQPAS